MLQRGRCGLCTQVSEPLEIKSTATPHGRAPPSVRVHASGPVLTEDDQHCRHHLDRSVLRADPGRRDMGRQEERGGQRLRGGSHASGSFHRSVRRDIHDDRDLGRRWLHQRHRRGDLHERSRLVSGAIRICPQPRVW